jgi:hypothetical protein
MNCDREAIFIAPSRCGAINGFYNFPSLFRIGPLRSVEVINLWGFSNCPSLMKVIFESDSHLTRINGFQGFQGCSTIPRILIPSSVEGIDSGAFSRCTSLVEVIFESGSRLKGIDGWGNAVPSIS